MSECKHGLKQCGLCHAMDGSLWPEEESYTHVEIALTVDGKELKKTFSAEECADELVKTIKLLAADRKTIESLQKKLDQAITQSSLDQEENINLKLQLEQAEAQVKLCQNSMKKLNARHNVDHELIEAIENVYLFECKESINVVKAAAIMKLYNDLCEFRGLSHSVQSDEIKDYAKSLLDNAKGDE